jgi:hypothetical protein
MRQFVMSVFSSDDDDDDGFFFLQTTIALVTAFINSLISGGNADLSC